MKRRRVPGLVLVTLTGCSVFAWHPPTDEEISRVRPGVSTVRDVLDTLGLPNRIEWGGNRQTWTYFSSRDSGINTVGTDAIMDAGRQDVVVKILFTKGIVIDVERAP